MENLFPCQSGCKPNLYGRSASRTGGVDPEMRVGAVYFSARETEAIVFALVGFYDAEGQMPESTKQNGFPRYAILAIIVLLVCIVGAGVTLAVRDREDKGIANQLERTQSELPGLGRQIASIKDADLTTANDFISAYAQN